MRTRADKETKALKIVSIIVGILAVPAIGLPELLK
jgi:hypothetical protein